MKPWLLPLLALCSSTIGSAADANRFDWPRWRGPDLNGISKETNWSDQWPAEGPKALWKASVGTGFSSLAVADGRVFTMGNRDATDTVFAFDALTGRELWKQSYPCPLDDKYHEGGPYATPTVEDGRVFTLSKRAQLYCFDAASGRVLWETNLMLGLDVAKPEWGFSGSVLIEEELLLLNVGDAGTAVNKRTGKVVWTSGKTLAGYATPVPYGKAGARSMAMFSGASLVGVRIQDGKELWRYPWVERWKITAADPILVGIDKIFISTFGKGCALLRLGAGVPEVVWENKNMANHFNSCVLLDGCLYGVHGNTDQPAKDLRCLDASTGEVKWKHDGLGLGSLMAAAGKLLVLSERGELVVAQSTPTGFEPGARAQVLGGKCWTVPVLSHGIVYCRNARGDVAALDLRGDQKTQPASTAGFVPLFASNGPPQGWTVRAWNEMRNPGPTGALWRVEGDLLHGSAERGSWLISNKEYGDFELEFDFKLGPRGNSGCALRAPMFGDPAFDGMELQMADYRYNPEAKDSELTGGIYRAIAPRRQIYKPTEWNHYHVVLRGPFLRVELNGELIQDLNLDEQNQDVKRHDGTAAPAVKDRPRRGHIGFQNLSRGADEVLIRGARLKSLD
jgi:outer membrane protein assembly factor BamB